MTAPTHVICRNSLQALLKAISTLLDIPLPNLILFHSQGAQVSDEVFSDICNESAAESVRIANISANGNASANANANADDGDDHKDKDNDGRGEGREAGGEERKVIALYAFDRESFIAEPEDFVLGVEEELILAEGLVGTYPLHSCLFPVLLMSTNRSLVELTLIYLKYFVAHAHPHTA